MNDTVFHEYVQVDPAILSDKIGQSDEWGTPQSLFDDLNAIFQFTLDPCSSIENRKCLTFYTKSDNGLDIPWDDQRVFMNPPYSKGNLDLWTEKAKREVAAFCPVVVGLLPNSSDTRWYWDNVQRHATVIPIKGRLRFEYPDKTVKTTGARAPSILAIWSKFTL